MAMAVSKMQNVGREIAKQAHFLPRPAAEASRDKSPGKQKFGALVPNTPPWRDNRVNTLDYASAPFVTQLIASRDTIPATRLQQRTMADHSATAYEAAEALPYTLPAGLYLETSI